jgi:cell division protein FtsA
MLAEIIEPRMEEMFNLARQELERSGYEDLLPAGIVLTGGTTLLPGMTELAERVFGVSARIGRPRDIGGLADVVASPVYATGVGLVRFGLDSDRTEVRFRRVQETVYQRVKSRMTEWLGLAF